MRQWECIANYQNSICTNAKILSLIFASIVTRLTGVWLAVNISGLNISVVWVLALYAKGPGFESRLRFDFSPPVTQSASTIRYICIEKVLFIDKPKSTDCHCPWFQHIPHLYFVVKNSLHLHHSLNLPDLEDNVVMKYKCVFSKYLYTWYILCLRLTWNNRKLIIYMLFP